MIGRDGSEIKFLKIRTMVLKCKEILESKLYNRFPNSKWKISRFFQWTNHRKTVDGVTDEKCIPGGENQREKIGGAAGFVAMVEGDTNGRCGLRDVNLHLQNRFPFSPSQVFRLLMKSMNQSLEFFSIFNFLFS